MCTTLHTNTNRRNDLLFITRARRTCRIVLFWVGVARVYVWQAHGAGPSRPISSGRSCAAWCCDDAECRVSHAGSSNFECSSLLQNAYKLLRFDHTQLRSPFYDMAADRYCYLLSAIMHFLSRGGRLLFTMNNSDWATPSLYSVSLSFDWKCNELSFMFAFQRIMHFSLIGLSLSVKRLKVSTHTSLCKNLANFCWKIVKINIKKFCDVYFLVNINPGEGEEEGDKLLSSLL